MLPQELIRKKRDGNGLDREELAFLVDGIASGSLTEGQIAAFAMAVFFRGLDHTELPAFTLGMARSGRQLDWRDAVSGRRARCAVRAEDGPGGSQIGRVKRDRSVLGGGGDLEQDRGDAAGGSAEDAGTRSFA